MSDQIDLKDTNTVKRFINPNVTLPLAFGCLTFSSFMFFRSMKSMYLCRYIKKQLLKAPPLSKFPEPTKDLEIIHTQGRLKYDKNAPLFDPHFGINPVNSDSIGIIRKVEYYKRNNLFNVGEFRNISNRGLIESIRDKQNINLVLKAFTRGELSVNNHQISKKLFESYGFGNMSQIPINYEEVNTFIKQNFQIKEETKEEKEFADSGIDEEFDNNDSHPYRQLNNRHLVEKDNFIFMQKELHQFSEGDIRISFYEVDKADDVTILAAKKEETLTNCLFTLSGFEKLERKILIGKNEQDIKPIAVSYMKSGTISNKDFVQFITTQLEKDERFKKLFYFIVIFLLYEYIEFEIAYSPEVSWKKLVQFYTNYKDIYSFNQLREKLKFEDYFKSFFNDSRALAVAHYIATAVFIRTGALLFIFIGYQFGPSKKNPIEEKKEENN